MHFPNMPLPLGTESTANLYIFIISLHIKRKIFLTKEIIGLHSRATGEKTYKHILPTEYDTPLDRPCSYHARTNFVPCSFYSPRYRSEHGARMVRLFVHCFYFPRGETGKQTDGQHGTVKLPDIHISIHTRIIHQYTILRRY